ncbi:MAG: glycogen synthase GlgA [Alphaproteobacteria bacterium]|nr:glycogen synthase GlgA [Alphaproteobacteria bacterium]
MRVLFVTAEAYPLAKTGGLADVCRALPLALMHRGIDVRLLLPGYPRAYTRIERPRIVAKLPTMLGISDATLVGGVFPDTNLPVMLIDSPTLFRRGGGLYQDIEGQDWPDNAQRFAFLARVGMAVAVAETKIGWVPDVIHANDWHAGLLPLMLRQSAEPRPKTVFTTHNMAFQGNFPTDVLPSIGVSPEFLVDGGIEFYGQVSYLKAGLNYADRVTTVSPTYASEIVTPEFGCGMEGIVRARGADFSGILNGIDDALWNPATDPYLAHNYRESDISGKRACKTALQREFGLPIDPDKPLIGFVSRITHQKMADVILAALPWIAEQDAQVAIVGEGDPSLEAALTETRERYAENVALTVGYDEPLAHQLQAASDILLAPARFEPCGLTQLYALRYGTLPVVRRTGGLADTVVDATATSIADRSATGFVFDDADLESLKSAVGRALALYREPLTWRRLQIQAMSQNFSWDASAAKYAALYSDLTGAPLTEEDDEAETALEIARQAAS